MIIHYFSSSSPTRACNAYREIIAVVKYEANSIEEKIDWT